MVKVIDGAFCDTMHIIDAALQEAAPTDSCIDEGERSELATFS
jgi:hypothetical protein